MEVTFADAFYYIALINDVDGHHVSALNYATKSRTRMVTTEYVLIEVADALGGTNSRNQIEPFIELMLRNGSVEVVQAERSLLLMGLAYYAQHEDKKWSLTDCISFVVMKQRGITDALTHDHHFKQAGFRVLL